MSSPSTADHTLTDPPGPETIRREAGAVLDSVGTVVVGRERSVRLALAGVLAGGHVMFEDVPGLGKTLMARALAQSLGLAFRRVQCTPDLQPADITGSFIYDPADGDPDGGIPPGTNFDDIPDSWFCPVCGARKADFEPYED